MRWVKLGHIFDPHDYVLSTECFSHARAPQAVKYGNFIRIFFCSQTKLINGKCISIPQFCDFELNFKKVIDTSKKEIINLGNLGEFDEHGIFPLSVSAEGEDIFAFTTGWSRRHSVPIDMSIGLAKFNKRKNMFDKFGKGGPILTSKFNENCMVGDAHVKKINGIWYMWYIFSKGWLISNKDSKPERHYRISVATSKDLINWERKNKFIVPTLIENECQAMPTVFFHQRKYHMIFCFRSAFDFRKDKESSYRLGYAYSDDLEKWVRDDKQLNIDRPENGWDSEMMCYPSTLKLNEKIILFYNGNNFGKNGFGAFILE